MRVVFLLSGEEDRQSAEDLETYYYNPTLFDPEGVHEWTRVLVSKRAAVQEVVEAVRKHPADVYYNLCDGTFDEPGRAGPEVVQALEMLGVAYTGGDPPPRPPRPAPVPAPDTRCPPPPATPEFYTMTKQMMKLAAVQAGIATAPFVFAAEAADVEEAARLLRFPTIVKHVDSGSSIGMTRRSKCADAEELREEAGRFLREFGAVLIEEYIPGREFTVLAVENAADPSRPHGAAGEEFKHYDGTDFVNVGFRWRGAGREGPDGALAGRLMEVTARAFAALRCNSYGRCDLRVDPEGNIVFLEMNANCAMFYATRDGASDIIVDSDGGHLLFVERVLAAALAARERRVPKCRVRLRGREGPLGLFAAADLRPGEPVLCAEGLPAPSSPAGGRSGGRGRACGYVQGDGERHNARFEGLTLVASRPIARGEEILVPPECLHACGAGAGAQGAAAPKARAGDFGAGAPAAVPAQVVSL
eukprot:tig00020563_g11374.t1